MLGAIAGIDTVIVDCIDAISVNWNVRQNYIHSQLELITEVGGGCRGGGGHHLQINFISFLDTGYHYRLVDNDKYIRE